MHPRATKMKERTTLRPVPVPECRTNVSDNETEWISCGKPAVGHGCDGPSCAEHLCHHGRCPHRRLYADHLSPLQQAALRWKYATDEERLEALRDLAISGLLSGWERKCFPLNDEGRAYLEKLDEATKPNDG